MKSKRTRISLQSISKKKIEVGLDYLVKIDNNFKVGYFIKEWYGLIFDDGSNTYQLDGKDGTRWQSIWKLPNNEVKL
jgi:hypothetical protein